MHPTPSIVIISAGFTVGSSPQHQRMASLAADLARAYSCEVQVLALGRWTGSEPPPVKLQTVGKLQEFLRGSGNAGTARPPDGGLCRIAKKPKTSILRDVANAVIEFGNKAIFVLWAGSMLARRHRQSLLVLSTSPSGISHLAALLGRTVARRPWIADFRDPFFGNPVKQESLIVSLVKRVLEPLIVASADICVFTTESTAGNYTRRYPRHASKMLVVYNGYCGTETASVASAVRGEGEGARVVLSYTGYLGPTRPIAPLLAGMRELLRRDRACALRFRVVVAGNVHSGIVGELADLKAEGIDIEFRGSVPRAEALKITKASDWCVVLQYSREQLPSKIFDAIGVGRPVFLISCGGETEEFVLGNDLGVAVSLDASAIADAMQEMARGGRKCWSERPERWSRGFQNGQLVRRINELHLVSRSK